MGAREMDNSAPLDASGLAAIRSCVTRFRQAMEKTALDREADIPASFPKGCCHYACALLKRFLLDNGFGECQTMLGNHPTVEGYKHQWLQKEQITIDITADQFGCDKVIVTLNSQWHRSLKGKPPPLDPDDVKRFWEGDDSMIGDGARYRSVRRYIQGD